MSNGHKMLYYGGASFGWNGVADLARRLRTTPTPLPPTTTTPPLFLSVWVSLSHSFPPSFPS